MKTNFDHPSSTEEGVRGGHAPSLLVCLLRKKHVAATPEEILRQAILKKMIEELGFSPEGLVVECALDQMPHLGSEGSRLPNRRADIVYFSKGIHPSESLYPLLVIECKAVPLTSKVIRQVVGYNHYIKAHFVAVANGQEIRLGWRCQDEDYEFISHLPSCRELIDAVQTNSPS